MAGKWRSPTYRGAGGYFAQCCDKLGANLLVAEERNRNPGRLAYCETARALCSYFGGDYQQAAMSINKTTVPSSSLYHLIAAAMFGEGGYLADMERAWLEMNEPILLKNLQQETMARLAP